MSVADDGLRKLMHTNLKPLGFEMHAVETGGTTSGLPDTWWLHAASRTCGWIEHKRTGGWAVEFRPHQIGFILRHARAGVRTVAAVRARGVGSTKGAKDGLWLWRGTCVDELSDVGLRHEAGGILLTQFGPPRSWDWRAVAHILTDGGF